MISFSILTLGCKVNSYESEAVINELISHGWEYKSFDEVCDCYIINTCTVTSTSDQKSRQMLHSARRRNSSAIIVAMGCYTQLYTKDTLPLADIIIGSNNKLQVYELINSFLETRKQINAVTDVLTNPSYEEMKINKLETRTRAFIKIQDGCENYCSYCAIPYSRGKIRSRNQDNIIEEINHLVSNGTKEVILAGINTGTYGKDLNDTNLAKLIERIMLETKLYRLRLSSIELKEITDELLSVLKKYQSRVAMHLHIPLQAGSDSVLKRMHRKYLTEDYLNLINKIREIFPNIALTTDVLAGFVGETEQEFREACEFIKKINFFEMHVFPYSRRKGTEADKMEGHLDKAIKTARAKQFRDIANLASNDYIRKFIGSTVEIIVENKKNNYYHGHSSNYLDVNFKSDEELVNKVVSVKLEEYDGKKIYGTIVEVVNE